MQPAHPPLPELLASLRASDNSLDVAYGHNYLFEERVAAPRQSAYEEELGLTAVDLKAWKDQHKGYLSRKIHLGPGETPETFHPINVQARLNGLDKEQWLVRLEKLDQVLVGFPGKEEGVRSSLEILEEQLTVWRRKDDREAAALAEQFLEHLCEVWNTTVRRDHRPSFAVFYDEVQEDEDAPSWANHLRNRLGLSHYDVPVGGSPIPVALMRYRVREVATSGGGDLTFAVPTVLDGDLNAHFFPAPQGVSYGRTLDLQPDDACERLVAEVLHRRVDYAPDHFYKVGWVTESLPSHLHGARFARLRNGHLFCLRYESGRDDFGEEIPEGDLG
jgi:hypothetical protein